MDTEFQFKNIKRDLKKKKKKFISKNAFKIYFSKHNSHKTSVLVNDFFFYTEL